MKNTSTDNAPTRAFGEWIKICNFLLGHKYNRMMDKTIVNSTRSAMELCQ